MYTQHRLRHDDHRPKANLFSIYLYYPLETLER